MKNLIALWTATAASLLYLVSDAVPALHSAPSTTLPASVYDPFFAPSNTATLQFSNAKITRKPTSNYIEFSTRLNIVTTNSPPQLPPLHLDNISLSDDGLTLIIEFDSPLPSIDVYRLSSEIEPIP